MKKIFIIMLAIVAISSSLVSCLGNDNKEETKFHYLTDADKSAIMGKVAGSYRGYTKYFKTYSTIDSLASNHVVLGDTTVIINYPVSLLSAYVTSPVDSMAKKELANASPVAIYLKAYLPYVLTEELWQYWQRNDLAEFVLVPKDKEIPVKTANHSFKIVFATDYVYFNNRSYGNMLQYVNKMSQGYVNFSKLLIDDKSSYNLNVPTCFFGNKE